LRANAVCERTLFAATNRATRTVVVVVIHDVSRYPVITRSQRHAAAIGAGRGQGERQGTASSLMLRSIAALGSGELM